MRSLPHLLADPAAYLFTDPTLNLGETVFGPGDPVTGWDYLTPLTITVQLTFDTQGLARSTGILDLSAMGAFLQIDCLATGLRRTVAKRLSDEDEAVSLQAHLEAGTVASELEVRTGLVLLEDDPPRSTGLAAKRRGDRLTDQVSPISFLLEGSGATFPIESFDFERAGLPPDAPWHLHFSATSLTDSFKRSVRLNVNSSHTRAADLLAGGPGLVQSVLHNGVVLDLLLAGTQLVADDTDQDMPEGSVGEVVSGLCEQFLGQSLPEFASDLQNDPVELMTRLRGRTGLLHGDDS